MINIKQILENIKQEPFREIVVKAPHCGRINFKVNKTDVPVYGPTGNWKERPGTLLASLEREKNSKPIYAQDKGKVVSFGDIKDSDFVQAGTPLMTIRHFLTKSEVIDIILQQALNLFLAPEKGKYYFTPDVDSKVKSKGCRSIKVHADDEVFILSRMKRETVIPYQGAAGIIYAVYFTANDSVESGSPLIGVCPEDQLDSIEEVVVRIQSEWQEKE